VKSLKYGDKDVVVKRTQRSAMNVMSYITMIKDKGINVVTSVKLQVDNPQQYEDTNFVKGQFI